MEASEIKAMSVIGAFGIGQLKQACNCLFLWEFIRLFSRANRAACNAWSPDGK